jgi:hypothetical protein
MQNHLVKLPFFVFFFKIIHLSPSPLSLSPSLELIVMVTKIKFPKIHQNKCKTQSVKEWSGDFSVCARSVENGSRAFSFSTQRKLSFGLPNSRIFLFPAINSPLELAVVKFKAVKVKLIKKSSKSGNTTTQIS